MVALAERLQPLMSSVKSDWLTPLLILDLVRQVAPIALDPCTTSDNPTGAARFFTEADDGLAQRWVADDGLIYVNPPYGRGIGQWVNKCVVSSWASQPQQEVIALLPSRTDTAWFQQSATQADARCYWTGRIMFVGADYGAPFPSVFCYWGERSKRFKQVFSPYGWCP